MTRNRFVRLTLAAAAALPLTLAVPAWAEETECRGAIGPVALDNIRVPEGATCELQGTRANGTVKVESGATLRARGVHVNGNVQAEGAALVSVTRSSFVGGSIQIVQGGGATIGRTAINGDLFFDSNTASISARDNLVGGSLQAFQNSGGVLLINNVMRGNLQCKENEPAPTGGGNQAPSKEDQCEKL